MKEVTVCLNKKLRVTESAKKVSTKKNVSDTALANPLAIEECFDTVKMKM